jgi:O-acetyl-ADP-ribose deacetylase (regulator of RNase III)
MEAQFDGIRFEVVEGDLTVQEVDAIVNAANDHFWMGGGVAGAIKRAGGGSIEIEAMTKGPVPVGESVVSDGGRLPARYVIHAAVMGQDLQTSARAIRDATRTSLLRAEELGIKSIAFPAFGTGVGGFSPSASAEAMIEAATAFVRSSPVHKLHRIVFVLFSPELAVAFEKALTAAMP